MSDPCPAEVPEGQTPCDGTWQAYRRHNRRGDRPCADSLRSWREHVKVLRAARRQRGKQ